MPCINLKRLDSPPTKVGFTSFHEFVRLQSTDHQIVRLENYISTKKFFVRSAIAVASAALFLMSSFSANAATAQSTLLNPGGAATPAKVCGYPDNPDRSCEWWANKDTCYLIFQSNAPDWQKMACLYAGFSRR